MAGIVPPLDDAGDRFATKLSIRAVKRSRLRPSGAGRDPSLRPRSGAAPTIRVGFTLRTGPRFPIPSAIRSWSKIPNFVRDLELVHDPVPHRDSALPRSPQRRTMPARQRQRRGTARHVENPLWPDRRARTTAPRPPEVPCWRCHRRARAGSPPGGGPVLSDAWDHHRRAGLAGRRDRHHRPPARRADDAGLGPAGERRQPGRSHRDDRYRDRRQGAARRPHARAGGQQPCDQSEHVPQAALRYDQELRAGGADAHRAAGTDRHIRHCRRRRCRS